jgi:hypothetical protein
MNAIRVLAAVAILITSQAYAAGPVVKQIGCPNDAGCTPSGNGGGGNAGATKSTTSTTTTTTIKAAVAIPKPVPKINAIALDSNNILTGQPLGVTVSGEVGACNYYLTIVNTDNNEEWPLPKSSTFPAPQKITLDMNDAQYTYGNYKVMAKARDNDTRPGLSCLGGGNYLTFKKSRAKITMAADTPKIVDILIEPGKKVAGNNRYRSDELIKFNVVGSVENSAPADDANRCGWTVQLVDKNGTATSIGANSRFGVWQSSKPLTSIVTGSYTLTVKTTSEDDGLAKQPCLGKASKKIDIFRVPGVIKNLNLSVTNNAADIKEIAKVTMMPQIVGPTCSYKVTRIINKGKAVKVTTHIHVEGVADTLPVDVYPDDQTELTLIVSSSGENYWEGGSCEGSAQKILTVYDDKKEVIH